MANTTKAAQKKIDARISAVYSKVCHGIQVNIMDLGKIMNVGRASVEAGDDDVALGEKIRTFVETIRVK